MATIDCPECGQQLELDEAYRDWTVRCPHCGGEFVPGERGKQARRARRIRRREEDEDDYFRDPERDREEALRLVAQPGMWLEICGWAGVVLFAGACALAGIMAAAQQNNPNNPNAKDDLVGFFVMSCCAGVFGVPYSVAMAAGGRHMRNLSSRNWAMAGAILGLVALPLFGCLGIVQAGLGLWALITLENPIVRRAFGLPGGQRSRRDWDD